MLRTRARHCPKDSPNEKRVPIHDDRRRIGWSKPFDDLKSRASDDPMFDAACENESIRDAIALLGLLYG